jgi:hypothetical protein
MKWHIICLITICWLLVSPVEATASLAVAPTQCGGWQGTSLPGLFPTIKASQTPAEDAELWLWAYWQGVVWAYGACAGRVTLCNLRVVWRWRGWSGQKKGANRKRVKRERTGQPSGKETEVELESDLGVETEERLPLSLVLRPGVLLTKRGLQLRPMIARLGQDVAEYWALWWDEEKFQAAIQHLLKRRCPLCESEKGFRCIGNTERSVIPPGRRERVWFWVQKVQCRSCGAITRILPTFCIPFKSHHAQTIQNVLENCWQRNNSYRETTGILNQSLPPADGYQGHTLAYEWTLWLGGTAIHLPQLLVWLGLQLPRQNLLDECFMKQDKGTDNHRIFAVTLQDPHSTALWNIVRVDRNNTEAFKQTLQQLKQVGIQLQAITSDGWPAILRAVREELASTIHLLCYFHAKHNIFETLEKYRRAKKLPASAPELTQWRQAFFEVLEAPSKKLYRARLRTLTKRVSDEPILLARCQSLSRKINHNTYRLRSPLLSATTSRLELTFKFLTRKMESHYSFRRSKCKAAQKSLTTWALVRNFVPYLPGAKFAGQSPAELAGADLEGLPWLQYVNLKLSEVA